MKRALLVLLVLAAGAGLVLGLGRAPSRYVLEAQAAVFQQERREQFFFYTQEIAKAAKNQVPTDPVRRELDQEMFKTRGIHLGGWDVVFLPPGARLADPSYSHWGEVDPSEAREMTPLAGVWKVKMRPVSWTARVAAACGLGPRAG